jgi:hypothetical protein
LSRPRSAFRARWWAGRQPGNPLGHHLPVAPAGLALAAFWGQSLVLFGVAVVLFPDGRLPTRFWRVTLRIYCAIVAILKYRLYEIDRIISRTLAYAIVADLLVGVYAGLVLLATEVLRVHTPVAVAAATLAAAALFNPVRRRVQHAVDRRFNRARYNAERMVAEFAGRLQDAVDPDAVRADLAGVVLTALEPAHVSVRLSGPR